jgi:hypothetical protein
MRTAVPRYTFAHGPTSCKLPTILTKKNNNHKLENIKVTTQELKLASFSAISQDRLDYAVNVS